MQKGGAGELSLLERVAELEKTIEVLSNKLDSKSQFNDGVWYPSSLLDFAINTKERGFHPFALTLSTVDKSELPDTSDSWIYGYGFVFVRVAGKDMTIVMFSRMTDGKIAIKSCLNGNWGDWFIK